ncbi:MAG: hypothetical protein ACYCU7_15880 [Acidimicrobiales bacterium]
MSDERRTPDLDERLRELAELGWHLPLPPGAAVRAAGDQRRVRRRVGAVLAAVVLAAALGTGLGLSSNPPRPTRPTAPTSGALQAVWAPMRTEPGAFGPGADVRGLVAWRGRLVAVGSVRGCAVASQLGCPTSGAEWISVAGGPWRRRPLSVAPRDFADDVALVATSTELLLVVELPAGAGWGTAPPPYENLTSVWASTDGTHWTRQAIPLAMTQSALGPLVAGHRVVLAVADDRARSQVGVWIRRAGRWRFRPTVGTQGAGVFAWSTSATPTGFVAGGEVPVGVIAGPQEPAVWSSADGVRWQRTVLGTATGQVTAVATVAGHAYAGGEVGSVTGRHAAYWTVAGGEWKAMVVTGALPPPDVDAIVPAPAGPAALSSNGTVALLAGGAWRSVPTRRTTLSGGRLSPGPSVAAGGRVVAMMNGTGGAAPWQLTFEAG